MKKFLKITGIVVLLAIVFLAAAPFIFKGSLEKIVKRTINENLNATVAWEGLDISLLKSFPDAALIISNFSLINKAPFEGDTLVRGKSLKLNMGITQLFNKSDEAIQIDGLLLNESLVNIKIDSLGNANYDIALKKEKNDSATPGPDEGSFSFALKNYEIADSRINYLDESSKTFLILTDLNHKGKGDLSKAVSKLETQTEANATFRIDKTEYLNKNSITLDANFELDLENQKYSFLENTAKINELPLKFNGFIKINETNSELDISFNTPSSDFKNFLAIIPKTYVKELGGVTTTGNFLIDGMLKGIIDETHIPKMDIKIASDNASFKYPDLPKAVRDISMNAELKNDTGLVKDTYLNIGGMTFKIDNEQFNLSGSIKNLTENTLVNLVINGTLNLANIEKVLPVKLEQDLTGIIKADISTYFDMQSVEEEQYQNIKNNGTISLSDFNYTDEAFNNPIRISSAAIDMSPGNIKLNNFEANSGQTDINATGTIQNLIPWIMEKQDLKGNFLVNSDTFNVNDFMSSEEEEEEEEEGAATEKTTSTGAATEEGTVKIPDFLDATIDFTAKKVLYDNVVLENTKGSVRIKDEVASLSNVTSKIFGGDIAFSGNVDTKKSVPTFGMNLDLQKVDIGESFEQLDVLKYIAPISKALTGNINTTIKLNGELNGDLTPNLATLSGNAIANILSAKVNTNSTPLLATLSENLDFLKQENLTLKDVKTSLDFSDGKITVKPFDFNIQDVKITAGGSHGLDKSIDYNLNLDVPAKYLGTEVNSLLAKLDPEEANSMMVSLPAGLKGSFMNPQVSLNTKAAINSLTKTLLAKQKEELINQGTDILSDLISGGNKPNDSISKGANTSTQQATEVVTDILGGLYGKKKKKKDTLKSGN
jgi:hypothetical protein